MSNTQVIVSEQGETQVNVSMPGVQGERGPSVVAGTIPDGTASAPGFAFTDDTDTGIFRPGANRFAFTTGGVLRNEVNAQGDFVYYGDAIFEDGGSFQTTLQIVTPASANRTITFPDATGTVALVGGSSGQLLHNLSGAVAGTSITFNATTGTRFTLPFGYGAGAGGAVTQETNKATAVTLNTACGNITMNGAALDANTAVTFTLNNDKIEADDYIGVSHLSGGNFGDYACDARAAAGSATVMLRNLTAGSLSDAVVLKFAVVKGSLS
jgi:hypothetical protein